MKFDADPKVKHDRKLYSGSADRPYPGIGTFKTPGLHGGRYDGKQQDQVLSGKVDLRNAHEAHEALADAFRHTSRATAKYRDEGSTASVAILTRDGKITAAQVGDSPIVVYAHHALTGEVKVVDLTADHTPDNPRERARIERRGGTIIEGRVVNAEGYGLNMSRTFGDHAFSELSDQPDIVSVDVSGFLKDPHVKLYAVTASDGATENCKPQDFIPVIKRGGPPEAIAAGIVDHAVRAAARAGEEESDNISVSLAEMRPGSRATVVGVADGHGAKGEKVSAAVQRTVLSSLDSYAATAQRGVGRAAKDVQADGQFWGKVREGAKPVDKAPAQKASLRM